MVPRSSDQRLEISATRKPKNLKSPKQRSLQRMGTVAKDEQSDGMMVSALKSADTGR